MVEDGLRLPGEIGEGLRGVCLREVQKDLAQSAKALVEKKLSQHGIGEADGFKVFKDVIETPKGGIIIFKGMRDYTADSIKSLEGFHRAWWEEAHTASEVSLELLRPTLRLEGAERWFSWNPRKKKDPVDLMFRGGSPPAKSVCVQANWRDNPWLTEDSKLERQDCLTSSASQYGHIWEGEYVSIIAGAYYARDLTTAKAEGRIGRVAADPLLPLRLYIDIGGTGARSDAFAMWAVQFVGREIRVLNYYEAVGQPLGTHLVWMRSQGYNPGVAKVILPHDGANHEKVYAVSYESAFRDAGYDVSVVHNQGRAAAAMRIEEGRRLFPRIWFDDAKTLAGREALGWYHEKKDDARGIGLGPEHDWSSHAADAFGLMCVDYEEPKEKLERMRAPVRIPAPSSISWMGH